MPPARAPRSEVLPPLARSRGLALLVSLRPAQWVKNAALLAAPLFAQKLLEPRALGATLGGVVVFSALASAGYLLNDAADRERDRHHPEKRRRPVAAGELPVASALAASGTLAAAGLGAASLLGREFLLCALAYVGLQALYTTELTHVVILDVFTVAAGFVVRVIAGAAAVSVPVSNWLYLCTLLLSLFLALAKRRAELTSLADEAVAHRDILGEYSVPLVADLFHAAIGGFGMLGCFVSIALRMKRVYSGLLAVEAIPAGNLDEMIGLFDTRATVADYLVAWLDASATGASVGRGLVHQASYLAPGVDAAPAQTLRVASQDLPETFFGVVPRSVMWRFMRPVMHRPGVRAVNLVRYHLSRVRGPHAFRQSHAAFAFLLDYVPDWKRACGPGGLIQYQSFIPAAHAARVFRDQLMLAQRAGLLPYLGVLKRHRPDPFMMSHAVDGYSLALDFRLTRRNRAAVWALAARLDHLVLEAGGRFYFAKDQTLARARLGAYLREPRVRRFLELKRDCDPEERLQTDLYRRLFVEPRV